ncbi:oligopeptide/dipeptide ABC transporter ATP-binding protein [Spirulina major]|uniref:oligopeptide/dipeptide ABC transporter ATP-binding protein n=1 Tax=Spirulina major TaxID=270636 RepID=UPI0009326808|nr:ABC transporter ATP-binding protein [Spirulina major]
MISLDPPPLLTVHQLRKYFPTARRSFLNRDAAPRLLHAVDDVSFTVQAGESVGLVGESGCGKSTLVRLLTRLLDPTSGEIRFEGREIGAIAAPKFARHPLRSQLQLVFQDPHDSLNPRHTAFDSIAAPLKQLGGFQPSPLLNARVEELAELVGLPAALLSRFPHQLSGGQKARVGIARAIALHPKLLILDEPTSALDVSVQAVILHLLQDLQARLGMSYLFVSHDLNVVRLLCDRIIVMYLGQIIEMGPTDAIFDNPRHPYTQALIAAIPDPGTPPQPLQLQGEPRSPIDPDPQVCRLYGRCPHGVEACTTTTPHLEPMGPDHVAACHRADVLNPAQLR